MGHHKKIRTYAAPEKESSSRSSKTSDFSTRNSFIHNPAEDMIAQYRDQPIEVAMKAFEDYHAQRAEQAPEDKNAIPQTSPEFESKIKSTQGQGQALPPKDRKYFEERFGAARRLHTSQKRVFRGPSFVRS